MYILRSYLYDILKIVKEEVHSTRKENNMKITQMSTNAIVVTDDKGIHTLFSYESEVLRYNPRDKTMTVYTNIANYSNTTKRHVRMFCEQYINSDEVVEASRAIFDPKKSYKDLKILHIFNDLV